jgi:hypothetical protein
MPDFWKDLMNAAVFGLEAQGVIAMRLLKIAAGGPAANVECRLMVTEKFAVAAAAHAAAARALMGGKSILDAAALGLAPVRRRVHANHQRLMRG